MDKKPPAQFDDDYFRTYGKKWKKESFFRRCFNLLNNHALRYLRAYRKIQQGRDPLKLNRACLRSLQKRYGLALDSISIGRGLYLGHPYNITVSEFSEIGDNCNLNKGAGIGPEKGGNDKDAPKIGSNVWIGVNAVVSGKISIGDNVLIAPNTHVNFDVPSNSIVIGNPAQIITEREDATEGYIHNVC